MSWKSGQSWQEVFDETALNAIPAHTVGLELLLYLVATSYDPDAEVDAEEVKRFTGQIQQASDALGSALLDKFKSADIQVDATLDAVRLKASRAIEDVRKKLAIATESARKSDLNLDETRKCAECISTELQPALSEFLTEFRKQTDIFDNNSADQGRKVMEAAVSEIDNISTSINLISLNASVEAARAGQYGKGFAVIASEIQELSQRSKQAVDRVRSNFR